jgi:TPR repeat protein
MYAKGEGVPSDPEQALAWFQKAAEQGVADAQFNLALIYAQGKGVAKDDQQALAWYRKAADQGSAQAQFNLGVIYAQGEGVAKDPAKAYMWASLATTNGYEDGAKLRDSLEQVIAPDELEKGQRLTYEWLAEFERRKGADASA